eukprot:scaffold169930_cov28-Tisochrysis_lutea.AAC.3
MDWEEARRSSNIRRCAISEELLNRPAKRHIVKVGDECKARVSACSRSRAHAWRARGILTQSGHCVRRGGGRCIHRRRWHLVRPYSREGG